MDFAALNALNDAVQELLSLDMRGWSIGRIDSTDGRRVSRRARELAAQCDAVVHSCRYERTEDEHSACLHFSALGSHLADLLAWMRH